MSSRIIEGNSISIDAAWLRIKYVDEGLSTYQIGAIVGHDPKTVWSWLKKHNIPIRERTWSNRPNPEGKPYQSAGWLWVEYFFKGRTTPEIAEQFGVWPQNILFFLRKAGIPTRTISETRAIKHWGCEGEANPMHGVRGDQHPNWKGGHTAERQAFYSTVEWRDAFKEVWKRDRKRCQRCDATYIKGAKLEVHHIIPFEVVELRATIDNLILLCMGCHDWVHSKQNTNRLFIKEA